MAGDHLRQRLSGISCGGRAWSEQRSRTIHDAKNLGYPTPSSTSCWLAPNHGGRGARGYPRIRAGRRRVDESVEAANLAELVEKERAAVCRPAMSSVLPATTSSLQGGADRSSKNHPGVAAVC